MPRRLGAEFFGTFWLTFAGCGSAVLAAGFPTLGIGSAEPHQATSNLDQCAATE
jgi:glycerol uptake facilitator-like aquaporin